MSILLVTLSVPASAQDALDKVLKKLEEIEKRLSRLEAEQKEEKKEEEKERERKKEIDVEELKKEVDVLSEELEKVRSGEEENVVTDREAKSLGLGPSAASIYRKKQGVSIAGYGEMLYRNFDAQDQSGDAVNKATELDFLRQVLYMGYRFNDRFLFNSEIEIEHASTSTEGSVSVEFAYLDYIVNDSLTLRGGLLLVPMGLINEFHEPNVFIGAVRPEVEQRILPSTWRENGAGIVGRAGIFDYRAYVINGFDASGFTSSGLRGGRQKGSQTRATDLAFVGRLDVNPTPGFFFGGSFYRGGSGQGQFLLDGRELRATTTIGELHAQFQRRGWDVRGLFARASLNDVRELNRALGLSGNDSIGEVLQGGYLQLGYNVLNEFSENKSLLPYYRYEGLNTQSRVPAGFLSDPARDRTFQTFGLEFKPIRNIALKADYGWARTQAKTGVNRFSLNLGYSF